MGAIMETNPPLWRHDFVQALVDCGVTNFDAYDAAILNPDNRPVLDELYQELRDAGIDDVEQYLRDIGWQGMESWVDPHPDAVFTGYKAINVLGLVAEADGQGELPLVDGAASSMVDGGRRSVAKMLRLAESTSAIVVNESLRDALLEKGFGSDIAFYDLKEAAV